MHPWVPPPQVLPAPPALPVEPREYHEFLRTPRHRWWRPLAALGMGGALWFAATLVFTLLAMGYDLAAGNTTMENYTSLDRFVTTPAFFLCNNLALASAIPIAMLTQWACYGQRPRWLSSIAGGFRWGWFGECLAWLAPLFAASLLVELLAGWPPALEVNNTTVFMIAAVLLTTPLQAAGEEYLLRGLTQRSVAAWLPRTAGLVVSTGISAVIFMALHGAGDPWLNTFYLAFSVIASVLVWRTGGLEAAVAMHVVNNVTSLSLAPFSDFSDLFDRAAGVGDPLMLVQLVVLLGAAALVLWRAQRRGLVTAAAPGAAVPSGAGFGASAPVPRGPTGPAAVDGPPGPSGPPSWPASADRPLG